MEPVTHLLTGACLARAGFHRRIAYATVAMAVAAEFPDIDTLWSLRGPVAGFEHHRGITHTLIGLPCEAALLLLVILAWDRWRRSQHPANSAPRRLSPTAVRVPNRWLALYGCLVLALLSHLLLDFTNNYGVRPFFPFNPRWYAASLVFIFDPAIFLLLLGGLLLPELFALISQEIEGKRGERRGAGWARAALIAIVALWSFRAYEHGRALTLAEGQTVRAPVNATTNATDALDSAPEAQVAEPAENRPLLPARRSLASPDPFNPFRWYTATDFGPLYLLGTADTRLGEIAPGASLSKPAPSPALSVARASQLGRVYLDWSPMPWITLSAARSATTVTFEDVRFMGSAPLLNRGGQPPLSGFVVVARDGQVMEGLDGRVQP